jgi:N-acetyl-alpha-D-glucosaminyl L-malate synthase BshA
MNIGIILYPTFGGSGVVATELGLELARRGHAVHFISYNQPARMDIYTQNVFFHEVLVPDYPLFEFAPYETALTSKIVDVTMHANLDVLHVHYAIPHATAAWLAQQILISYGKNIPFITTLHGTDITLVGKDSSYSPAITFAINNSNAVTAVSDNLRQETYQYFRITKEIEVIYNFIDHTKYVKKPDAECLKQFAAPNGEKVITHISNFRPVKRIPDVIRTFDIIRKSINAKLLMVGDGPERNAAERLVRELNLEKDVLFLGKVKQTYDILPCSDLFILPSDSESFGLSALEALASGVPVISTRAGGVPEVQIEGKTGFLSAIGDVQNMAENALYILSDNTRLEEFRKNAYARALDFSTEKIIGMYEDLYLKTIQEIKNQ